MVVRTEDEIIKRTIDFAADLVELQLKKKAVDIEIKELKDEYKEEGIAVNAVNKIINKIKAKLKMDAGALIEEEILIEKLEASERVTDLISTLNIQ